MSLKDVSAKLSENGSPTILLVHNPSLEVVQKLPLVRAKPEHKGFILSTWIRSYRGMARAQGYEKFYAKHEPVLAENMWRNCVVATDDDGYTVYAWVCGMDKTELHHCYVIPELRRLRVASRLIEHVCPELTTYSKPWPYSAHARVNPYLIGMNARGE